LNDFDDMIAAERRKLGEQAAVENQRKAEQEATRASWERAELQAWQETVGRIEELLSAAVRHLKSERVEPLPVLERRPARVSFQGVDGYVVAGHRWVLEGRFAIDKRGRAYPAGFANPLIPAARRPDPSIAKRMHKFLKDRGLVPGAVTGRSSSERFAELDDKARLRTGLAPDQLVLVCLGDDRYPYELDPATGVKAGRIHCFGKADDDSPVLLPADGDGGQPEPLPAFMARAVARLLT